MPVVVPSPLHKRWMEGSPKQFEQHLLRVIGLEHSASPIILVLPLGKALTSYPRRYAPPSADCRMLVNSWCSLVTFIVHLKQKAQVPPEGEKTWRAWGEGESQGPMPGCSLPSLFPFLPSNHCSPG